MKVANSIDFDNREQKLKQFRVFNTKEAAKPYMFATKKMCKMAKMKSKSALSKIHDSKQMYNTFKNLDFSIISD